MKTPTGKSQFIFLRLLKLAPKILIFFSVIFRLFSGTKIFSFPERNLPVIDSEALSILASEP